MGAGKAARGIVAVFWQVREGYAVIGKHGIAAPRRDIRERFGDRLAAIVGEIDRSAA